MSDVATRALSGGSSRRKRTVQACDNCRSKKSRCPGELPQCSLCRRLKQPCVYSQQRRKVETANQSSPTRRVTDSSHQKPSRLDAIEEKLDRLASALESQEGSFYRRDTPSLIEQPGRSNRRGRARLSSTIPVATDDHDVPAEVAAKAIEWYFSHFDCQPYPLLSTFVKGGLPSADSVPLIVLNALICLTIPSLQREYGKGDLQTPSMMTSCYDQSWQVLCDQYAAFSFDESYFQTLCLLAQVDFASGNVARAQTQISLGIKLAEVSGMLRRPQHHSSGTEASSAIVWTLFMMDRVMNTGVETGCVSSSLFNLPVYQSDNCTPGCQTATNEIYLAGASTTQAAAPFRTITTAVIETFDVWAAVVSYVYDATCDTATDFWRHNSKRAALTTRILESELKVQPHSYATTGSPSRVIEEPHLRSYYASRFYLHFISTGILCFFNHPFIIYSSMQHSRAQVPRSFLQQSYKIATINANWIAALLLDMDRSQIRVLDPVVGHIVSIAATIHLDRSLSKVSKDAKMAEQKFQRCRDFINGLASYWPNMVAVLDILDRLHRRLKGGSTMSYDDDEYDGRVQAAEPRKVTVSKEDAKLMWTLFDYAKVSSGARGLRPDPMPELTPEQPPFDADPAIAIEVSGADALPAMDVFQIDDDWALFGEPWTAYFPPLPDDWHNNEGIS